MNAEPKPVDPPPAAAVMPAGHITIEQARALFDQGATFVDARRADVYVQGHVQNAIRMDLASFKAGDPPVLALIPRSATIVVYCSGGDCDESEHVAEMLEGSGYGTIYVMHDGFPGWQAAGHPSETGEGIQ